MKKLGEYVKYRYSHLTAIESSQQKKIMLNKLRKGRKEVRDKFLVDVNKFLETNKDVIANAERLEKIHGVAK